MTGIKDQLQQTQEYPWDYGTAVADSLMEIRENDIYINSDSDSSADTEDDATDAGKRHADCARYMPTEPTATNLSPVPAT